MLQNIVLTQDMRRRSRPEGNKFCQTHCCVFVRCLSRSYCTEDEGKGRGGRKERTRLGTVKEEVEAEAGLADEEESVVVVTREMVESVAKERDVKRMCMDLAHVLL